MARDAGQAQPARMLPFSRDAFFALFAAYNQATWPAGVVAHVMGAAALWLAWHGGAMAGRVVPALLALLWGFTGVAYHGAFFAALNPAASLFAAGFVLQAGLLLWLGSWRGRLTFGPPRAQAGIGLALMAYAALLYPLLGLLAGHRYPAAPVFGITPCPLTIFTCGVLLLARGRVPISLLVVPVAWSLIGGSAAILLGVPQDGMLPVAGLLTAGLLWRRRFSPAA
jgi:hypothetical protein